MAKNNPPGLEFQDRDRNVVPDITALDHTPNDINEVDRIEPNDGPVNSSIFPRQTDHTINGQPDQAVDPIPLGPAQPAGVNIPVQPNHQTLQQPRNDLPVRNHLSNEGVRNTQDSSDSDDSSESTGVDDEDSRSTGVESESESNNNNENDSSDTDNSTNTAEREQNIANLEQEMDTAYGTRLHEHNLRPRRQRNTIPKKFRDDEETTTQLHTMGYEQLDLKQYACIYAKIHCHFGIEDASNIMLDDTVTTILTQYHISKGIHFFGDKGVKAVLKELRQLHDRMVMEPVDGDKLSREEKNRHSSISCF